ncbi:MAG: ribosome biogenesis GTPase Der [Deltaproteobacteria bacterium]|nr:ribosome biogenesis GTPase Der [Deltaproteobacteria bacterium]
MPERSVVIAIIGRPNVGKSTLFNRLAKTNKAIVDDTPGVTRDRNYADINLSEGCLTLVDTAGFDSIGRDGLISATRGQTLSALEEADGVILIMNGQEGLIPDDLALVELLRTSTKPVFYAVNKVDGWGHESKLDDFYALGVNELFPISAAHGYGIPDFLEALKQAFPITPSPAVKEPESVLRLAIVGRPNVGKSSLINRLLGFDRVIVSEIPGTTRDAVDISLTRGDKSYLLIDTAGIRRKGRVTTKLEKISIIRALKGIDQCHVAVLLLDAAEGITDQDTKVLSYAQDRGRGLVIAMNKWDLLAGDERRAKIILEDIRYALKFLPLAPVLTVSAKTGKSVYRILTAAEDVFAQFNRRVTTHMVNECLKKAVAAHLPPYQGRSRIKFYYGTQVSVCPPSFVIFVNHPEEVHFSYRRYLVNRFKEELGFQLTPINLILKEKVSNRH